jgi:hypothetical protein
LRISSRISCAPSQVDGAFGFESVKFNHTEALNEQTNPKEHIMKLRKNLEAAFLVAAVVTNFASYAVASADAPEAVRAAPAAAVANTVINPKVPVVVVKAHRLSAAEKAALN